MNTKYTRFSAFTVCLVMLSIAAFLAFRAPWNSPVKGSVDPSDGASRAWLFSRTDTLNAPVLAGNFLISNVRPGSYTLVLEGRSPYRDSFKQDVRVVEGQLTDVGIITMYRR